MKEELNKSGYDRTMAYDLIDKVKKEPNPKLIWFGIPEKSIGLLVGAQKTGKTTFAENLAISLAVGRKEFYGYKCIGTPIKVLFLHLEEGYRLSSRRLKRQIKSLDERELKLFKENFVDTPEDFPSYIVSDEDWNSLESYIRESKADVVFIDSLGHILSDRIEDSSVANKFFSKRFKPMLERLNKTVIVIHHTTKGNEKPIDMHNIAGSRVVGQEFQYAIGFGHLPHGGREKYSCMLYNKFIPYDDSIAVKYKLDSNYWFENLGHGNKLKMFNGDTKDFRINEINKNKILAFMKSQCSLGIQVITISMLKDEFLVRGVMSRDTLFKWLKKLINSKEVIKLSRGEYKLFN